MVRDRRIHWWQAMLPAGIWLIGARCTLSLGWATLRLGLPRRLTTGPLLRISIRLSRAGFNSWRFWNGKWR